jgi:hypothetical protein
MLFVIKKLSQKKPQKISQKPKFSNVTEIRFLLCHGRFADRGWG